MALISFALGFARSYANGNPVEMTELLRVVYQLGVVLISVLVVVYTVKTNRPLSAAVLWGLDIAVGILLASLGPLQEAGLGVALANLGDTLSLGILFVLASNYAKHSSIDSLTVVGLAWFSRIFFRNVGRIIAPVVGAVDGNVSLLVGIVVLTLSIAMAALLSGVVPKHRKLLEAESDTPKAVVEGGAVASKPAFEVQTVPSAADPLETRCRLLYGRLWTHGARGPGMRAHR